MGTPGPTPDVTPEDALGVFDRLERPCTPLTASEVGEELGCTRRTAHRKLEELAERGDLESKKTGARSRVWWRPMDALDAGDAIDRAGDADAPRAGAGVADGPNAGEADESPPKQFGEFVRAVKDYAIFTLDPDGTVTSWNEGAARIKGYEASEIVGRHFSAFYDEADAERGVPEDNLRAAAEEGRIEDEGWRVRADGSRFWADVVITAVRDEDGELQGFTKVTRDLTRRREYERTIEAERDLLDRVLDASPVGIIITDADGEATRINDGAAEILGLESEAERRAYVPGEYDIHDEEGDPVDAHPFERALETGEPVSDEVVRIERPDGSRRWLSVNAVPLTNEDGEVERVVSTGDDITELETRKRELESELSEVFGRVSDAFLALDEEWRFTHVNDRAAELFGHERAELLGERLWDLFPDAAETRAWTAFHAAMERQEQVSYERFSEVLGFWVEATVYPSDTGVSVYFRDVTERHERVRELERYRTVVETVEDGVYVVDGDGRFTMVNEAYAEMTGYSREELLGASVTKVVDEETAREAREVYRELVAGERETMRMEADVHTAAGETLAAEATFALLPDEEGEEHDRIGVVRDVSDRKAYERELEESERRYRTLVENFPEGLVGLFDEDLRYTAGGGELVNEAGIDLDEVVGTTIHERYPADLADEVEPHFRAALEGEQSSFEVEYHGRHLSAYTLPVRNAEDETYAGMLVVQDVTERVEREREIEEQRERYRRLVDVAPVSIVTYDADGDVRYANPATADLAGVDDTAELVGRPALEFIHPDDRAEAAGRIRRMLQEREAVPPNETRFVDADGEIRHVLVTSLPITADGEPAAQSVVVDITERKEYERELETRAREQHVIAELGQRALEDPSLEDLFDEAVRSVADTLGTDYARVLERREGSDGLEGDDGLLVRAGVGWRDGVVGEATVGIDSDTQAGDALDSAEPVVVEDLGAESRFDGSPLLADHDVSAGVSTVVGPPDEPWGVLGAHDADRREFTDHEVSFVRSVATILTTAIERTEYEERLNETVAELRESNERLEQFAYIASHDLQEPLRMVSSYLQLLDRRYGDELDGDASEFVEYAVDGAERMREMIDDLLSYSRVQTAAEPFEPTDSAAVLDRVLEGLKLRIEEEDAEVVRGELPTVPADDKQLEQVFQNLVSNALKYRDEEPPRIEIGAERRDDAWRFRVCDNGIGIDPAHADRIFDVFDRLHTREEYPGTGIGLALCERIVERHGGRIWVESALGEGSCFYFTIPYEATHG